MAGTVQLCKRCRQWMGAIDFHVAVRADYQNSCVVQIAGNVEQQVERAAVGVVQVFEHHQ